jgi:hypothetical protein
VSGEEIAMNYPMSSILATREMIWKHKDGEETPVIINLGRPLPRVKEGSEFNEWYCTFQIVGLGDETIGTTFGVDGMQALLLALKIAGKIIAASRPGRLGELDWKDVPHFGFPL